MRGGRRAAATRFVLSGGFACRGGYELVGTEQGGVSELQISGEKRPVTDEELASLISLCKAGVAELIAMEKKILEEA